MSRLLRPNGPIPSYEGLTHPAMADVEAALNGGANAKLWKHISLDDLDVVGGDRASFAISQDNGEGSNDRDLPDILSKRKKDLEIPIKPGIVRWLGKRVREQFSNGIPKQARIDWLRVRSTLEPIGVKLNTYDGHDAGALIRKFELAAELLINARSAVDLNEVWASINQAGEWLCSIAESIGADDQQQILLARMESHEREMMKWVRQLDGSEDACDQVEVQLLHAGGSASAKLRIYSLTWKKINDWLFFSRKIWRLAFFVLLVALVISIFVAEMTLGNTPGKSYVILGTKVYFVDIGWSFVIVSLAGFFGGALSVLLNARGTKVSALTYAATRFKFYIRLLLGACGAFVIYTLFSAFPGIFSQEIAKQFTESSLALIALGIVAGFSELLFQDALDRLSKRVPTSAPNGAEAETNEKATA